MLRDDLQEYRESRKSLVHEKPVPLSMETSPTRVAQTEAMKAMALMDRVDRALADSATYHALHQTAAAAIVSGRWPLI